MLFRLFFLFAVVPVAELALLIYVGSKIGVLPTITIVLVTAAAGAYMVKLEGLGVLNRFRENIERGIFPGEELIDGAMVLVAGALLLTPGFLTDITGFLLVFPASRKVIKKYLRSYIGRHISNIRIRRF